MFISSLRSKTLQRTLERKDMVKTILRIFVYAHGRRQSLSTPMGADNLRDREKHGSESITDPQCFTDRLLITSSGFHKKLSSSLTIDIIIMHLVTRPFGPNCSLDPWYMYMVCLARYGMVYGVVWRDDMYMVYLVYGMV